MCNVKLEGVWHHDSTAGVGFWCEDHKAWLGDDDGNLFDFDSLTIQQAQTIIDKHNQEDM